MMLERVFSCCVDAPERRAFFIADRFHSYGEFGAAIAAIRERLERDFGGERNIGVLAHDDLETYAAVFAIWFSGKTFVPIAPSNPPDRNARIVEQAGLRVLLSSREVSAGAGPGSPEVVLTAGSAGAGVTLVAPRAPRPEDIAYILFTSGSTGVPKGVPIGHGALEGFLDAFFALGFELGANDRFLQMFDLTFDLSLMSYCVPLVLGACAYTVPPDAIKPMYIYRLLEEQELTCALMVPSMLAHLRPYFGEIRLASMRYSLFCGEALYDDLVREWYACLPNGRISNVYGPTEATIFCLSYECARDQPRKSVNGVVSIGRPMRGVGALVVDEEQRPVGRGERGELCLTGRQLTPGYWNNAEKNRVAFFSHEGGTYYRTGDRCLEDDDGDLQYCGRVDHQVKVQGFRVELGEIEHHARELSGLKQVAAVACTDALGNVAIQLFLEGVKTDIPVLIARLKEKLPAYMIPSATTEFEALPLNVNGKIDRPALARSAQAAKRSAPAIGDKETK